MVSTEEQSPFDSPYLSDIEAHITAALANTDVNGEDVWNNIKTLNTESYWLNQPEFKDEEYSDKLLYAYLGTLISENYNLDGVNTYIDFTLRQKGIEKNLKTLNTELTRPEPVTTYVYPEDSAVDKFAEASVEENSFVLKEAVANTEKNKNGIAVDYMDVKSITYVASFDEIKQQSDNKLVAYTFEGCPSCEDLKQYIINNNLENYFVFADKDSLTDTDGNVDNHLLLNGLIQNYPAVINYDNQFNISMSQSGFSSSREDIIANLQNMISTKNNQKVVDS